jgi:hypothetical protein
MPWELPFSSVLLVVEPLHIGGADWEEIQWQSPLGVSKLVCWVSWR